MPNYEDFKRYGEIEKEKKASQPATGHPSGRSQGSWLSRGLSALKGPKKK
jgi:hypothetical protein